MVLTAACFFGLVAWEGAMDASAYREYGLLIIHHDEADPQLSGPFDLWSGEWWQIPLGGLHHGGLWHFGICLAAVLYLGRHLEPRMTSPMVLAFLLGSLFVTTLPRWILRDSVPDWFHGTDTITGLSGVAFSLFGALIFMRRADRNLAESFGEGHVLLGILAGLGCLAASTVGLFTNVDNLSHLAGFLCGSIWGFAWTASKWRRRFLLAGILGSFCLIGPITSELVQPESDARYHWWLAEKLKDKKARKAAYERALELDPNLEKPWFALAEIHLESGQAFEAWKTLLRASAQNRNLNLGALDEMGQRIWRCFSSREDRIAAWEEARRQTQSRPPRLAPEQLMAFFLETNQPLPAWSSLLQILEELPPPESSGDMPPEIRDSFETIWSRLNASRDRQRALALMDEQLGLDRRAWHLALIPGRDLVVHYREIGERLWAWEALMKELNNGAAYLENSRDMALSIWNSLPTSQRRARARQILENVFGAEALRLQADLGILSDADRVRYRLDQRIELPSIIHDVDKLRPRLNPDDPNSAANGVGL